jgi:acyl-CoA synthetase (NDP forming)
MPGIAVVSHSGGISSLTADMCGQAGLDLPLLGDEARDGINAILKGSGWAANPADVTGFANSESLPQIMEHMINDPGWERSSWRVLGRTPKLSRSSASAIGPTRVWCSCGQEAGTRRLARHA